MNRLDRILIGIENIQGQVAKLASRVDEIEESQRDMQKKLALYEGGFRGILLACAAAAASLTIWIKWGKP